MEGNGIVEVVVGEVIQLRSRIYEEYQSVLMNSFSFLFVRKKKRYKDKRRKRYSMRVRIDLSATNLHLSKGESTRCQH